MKAYRMVGEPEIWLVDKDGNRIAQCHTCSIECVVTQDNIRGGEGSPIVFETNSPEGHESCFEVGECEQPFDRFLNNS